jgi:chromosome segregation ATPase
LAAAKAVYDDLTAELGATQEDLAATEQDLQDANANAKQAEKDAAAAEKKAASADNETDKAKAEADQAKADAKATESKATVVADCTKAYFSARSARCSMATTSRRRRRRCDSNSRALPTSARPRSTASSFAVGRHPRAAHRRRGRRYLID